MVYDALRSAILAGKLTGGTHLIQERIAEDLGVSRVPVREALLHLEADGLVRLETHRGATVAWLSPAEIKEIFDIRGLLMSEAVRRVVPGLADDDIQELEQITARLSSATKRTARTRLNHAFYVVLWRSLDGPRLRSMIEKLEEEAERYYPPLEAPHPDHTDLIGAFRARNGELAGTLVRRHLEEIGRRAEARAQSILDERADVAIEDGHVRATESV
jgi:DNA-binding GntR family transcriptional regulator